MIWAYLLHLSYNMWHDTDGEKYLGWENPYTNYYRFAEKSAWRKVVGELPKYGINTVIIDLGDGIKYESHPEISCDRAWSKQEIKEETDKLRKMNIEVVPKLNFSTCHDAWLGKYARMVSTPAYYKVASDLIDEVCELFSPKYFHLGLDEESWREEYIQKNYGYCCTRQFELYWHDRDFFIGKCVKKGVRPWIWANYAGFDPKEFERHLTREPVYSASVYERIFRSDDLDGYNSDVLKGFEVYDKYGITQVPVVSTCYNPDSPDDLVRILSKKLNSVDGFMTAPWRPTLENAVTSIVNDLFIFNETKKRYYPEEVK